MTTYAYARVSMADQGTGGLGAVERTTEALDARHPELRARRRRIRERLAAGWSRSAIAREVSCDRKTVRRELARLGSAA